VFEKLLGDVVSGPLSHFGYFIEAIEVVRLIQIVVGGLPSRISFEGADQVGAVCRPRILQPVEGPAARKAEALRVGPACACVVDVVKVDEAQAATDP